MTIVSGGNSSDAHSLAIDNQGQVYAWGYNYYGQLGNNTTANSSIPVNISAITSSPLIGKNITSVSAGLEHSLAIDSTGQVYTWGNNSRGQLGNNTTTNSSLPINISTISGSPLVGKNISSISGGGYYSLVIDSTGQVYTWGYNNYGQLGNNTTTNSSLPINISTISGSPLVGKNISSIATGYNYSLAIDSTGQVYTWGYNNYGQLGNNTTTRSPMPINISTVSGSPLVGKNIACVVAGYNHSLVIDSQSQVYGWGANYSGQLGNNTTTDSRIPLIIRSVVASISFGGTNTTSFIVNSNTSIIAKVPAHAAGTVNVVITDTAGNSTTATNAYTYITVPSAPTLTATPGSSSVALSWTAPANGGSTITGYTVQRATNSTFTAGLTTVYTGTANSYNNTGLTPGTTYYFRVLATNAAGNSAYSAVKSAAPFTVPNAPTISAPTPGNTQAVVSWTAPSNGGSAITGYSLERSTVSNFSSGVTTVYSGTALSYTNTGLNNGTTYYYRVRATNAAGNSTYSSIVSVIPRTVPAAPTLTATAGSSRINLSWTTPANNGAAVTGYTVQRATNSTFTTNLTTVYNGTANSYSNTGLTPGTTYYYRVLATNAAGNGAYSAVKSAVPYTLPGAPALNEPAPKNNYIEVTWSAPTSDGFSNITGYKIEVSTNYDADANGGAGNESTATWSTVTNNTGNTNTSWNYNGTGSSSTSAGNLDDRLTYSFRISAINAAGTGVSSNIESSRPSFIDLSIDKFNLDVNLDPTFSTVNGVTSSAKQTVSFLTNIGVTLSVNTESSNGNMTNLANSSYNLIPTSGTLASPKVLDTNSWGFALSNRTEEQSNPSSSTTWAKMPNNSETPAIIKTTASGDPTTTNTTDVYYGAKVNANTLSGAYQAVIAYTIVGKF